MELEASLADDARLTRDYMFLVVASCLLALLGLLENSAVVLIGAMLVAPLMSPIRALAWGALTPASGTFRQALASVLACMAVFAFHERRGGVRAIATTTVLTVAIALPLGYNLIALVEQARLQALVEHLLTSRTVTVGQRMALEELKVDWRSPRPVVRLRVRATSVPSEQQVRLLESFVRGETGRAFRLVFEVSLVREVQDSADPL